MRRIALLSIAFAGLVVAPALAQAPPAGVAWARGTVDKLDADTLSIRTRDGGLASVALPPDARIQTLARKSVADIKSGDFVVSAGVRGPDGKIHASEVRILAQTPPGGGAQFDWDLAPGSVMTNASVGTVTKTSEGTVLHVTFKDGETDYTIGPDVPVLAPAPGDRSLLKPDAAVFVFARKAADGGLTANVVYVEKDGVKPPM
jgi:hypothetical protein